MKEISIILISCFRYLYFSVIKAICYSLTHSIEKFTLFCKRGGGGVERALATVANVKRGGGSCKTACVFFYLMI